MTSGIRAVGITDPSLRLLYASVYQAFRRRRSLLLLDLSRQIQIEELPWVAAIEEFRSDGLSSCDLSRQTLEELVAITLVSFPHAILPNKLLQELKALAKGADLEIPIVEELPADIFMGAFSQTFVRSAKIAATLLEGTLYSRYYGIDYTQIRELPEQVNEPRPSFFHFKRTAEPKVNSSFYQLCVSRAGVAPNAWSVATNGMIIEQQQILTTQNLAALLVHLGLATSLGSQFYGMAQGCFAWICRRLQVKSVDRHARLISVKNCSYAWRQMVCFLSLVAEEDVHGFLHWAQEHLERQTEEFRNLFSPALEGLKDANQSRGAEGSIRMDGPLRPFLGWSNSSHWLLESL